MLAIAATESGSAMDDKRKVEDLKAYREWRERTEQGRAIFEIKPPKDDDDKPPDDHDD